MMDPAEIEAAYGPFVAALNAGGFAVPEQGWSAELIGAHVAANNDLIAALAEAVARGETPHYDNEVAVDDHELGEFVTRFGGLTGVAREVRRSATRLADARRSLDDESASRQVRAVIHDNGELVLDGDVAIEAFIEGNATFHLQRHFDQLRELPF
jgi:hypothetical protein